MSDITIEEVKTDAADTIQLVPAEIADEPAEPEADDTDRQLSLAIRHVLERQLVAGQDLSSQLVVAATDASAAIVEAPAKLVGAVREGATLPTALSQASDAVADVVAGAGSRVRSAVGTYVGTQAVLPNAVVAAAAEVAGSLVRAQGEIAGAAVDGALTVVTAAARAEDVRDVFDREWRELTETVVAARGDIADALADARNGVRAAVAEGDEEN